MDIGDAVQACKDGGKVTRAGWNGPGQWIALSPGFTLSSDRIFSPPIAKHVGEGVGDFGPYLVIHTVQGVFVPWLASQTDILAEDWEVVP